jgi:hypothetical protein
VRLRIWTPGEVYALGVRTDLETAGSVLGVGRTVAHELARRGEFPVRVLRLGRRYVVPTADLIEVLGLPPPDVRTGSPAREPDATKPATKTELGSPDDGTLRAC